MQEKLYDRFRRLLYKRGLDAIPGETPTTLARRAALKWPQKAAVLQQISDELLLLLYAAQENDRPSPELRKQLHALQLTL